MSTLYYHPELMPDEESTRLFAVYHPHHFQCYADHEAALQLRIHDLVQDSRLDAPILVQLEELGISHPETDDRILLSARLWACDAMRAAAHWLYQRWQELEHLNPADVVTGGIAGLGLSRAEQLRVMEETTLDTWLQALSAFQG